MDKLSQCRICKVGNVRMHTIANTYLQKIYEKLIATPLPNDAKPLEVCVMCCARLKNCHQLMGSCLQSESLALPEPLRVINKLVICPVVNFNYVPNTPKVDGNVNGDNIKMEPEVQVKQEPEEAVLYFTETYASDNEIVDSNITVKEEDVLSSRTDEMHSENNKEHEYKVQVTESQNKGFSNTIEVIIENDLKPDYNILAKPKSISVKNLNDLMVTTKVDDISTNAPVPKKLNVTKDAQCVSKRKEVTFGRIKKTDKKIKTINKPIKEKKVISKSSVANTGGKQCDVCKKHFNHKVNLKAHMRIHTGEKPYKCEVCEKRFNQRINLNTHMNIHTGANKFQCDLCGRCFGRKHSLAIHINVHAEDKPYKCHICEKGYVSKTSLNTHIQTHSDKKAFKCILCDKRYSRKNYLNDHMRLHTGERPYQCGSCNECFTTKSNLNSHMHTHTNEKPYVCEICGLCFSMTYYLKRHMRAHNDVKSFKCKLCDEHFRYKYNLNRHMRNHLLTPFSCDVCGKCFRRESYFKDHYREHNGEKPFKCDVCEKKFAHKEHFRTHIETHNIEKPFKCDVCEKGFNSKSRLNTHLRIHASQN